VRSIRAYLLSRLLVGAALVLAVGAAVVYLVSRGALEAQFDRNLADREQALASLLSQVGEEVELEFSGQLMPEYERAERPDYFEIRVVGGPLLERSESLVTTDGPPLEPPREAGHEARFWTAPLPDGRSGRYVAQVVEVHHVYPEEGPQRPRAAVLRIVVARGRDGLVAATRGVLAACAAGSLVLLGLLAVLIRRAVRRGLAPADRLAAALDALEVEALPEGLGLGELPAELAPVAAKTDALIRRVDDALERERRTSADIAHELRTPISEVLTASEVALRDGSDPAAARRALAHVRDLASRMGRSVSTLLELARLEMGDARFAPVELALEPLVAELLRTHAALARERGLEVRSEVAPDARVRADGDALRIVASNLIGNAVTYATAGGRVVCRSETAPDGWRLVVENDSDALRREDLASLTRPFWRKDRARADRQRSGLGLALSVALAEKSGMRLEFALDGGLFRAALGAGVPRGNGYAPRPEPRPAPQSASSPASISRS